jgi:hypothetical protein
MRGAREEAIKERWLPSPESFRGCPRLRRGYGGQASRGSLFGRAARRWTFSD